VTVASSIDLPPWHIEVEGCFNFRDAGGWPTVDGGRVRSEWFYRSDDALRITDSGRRTVEALGLAVVVDLRQHDQWVRRPGFLPAERTVHVPFVDHVIDRAAPPPIHDVDDMVELYEDMIERGRGRIATALDVLADRIRHGPVLVHCAFGKDRAGIITALAHIAAGVDTDAIVEDFARSHEPSMRRRAATLADPLPDDPDTSKVPSFLFSAPGDLMRLLLDRQSARHGSPEDWLASFPIDVDTRDRLRDALVER
jgi:protein-tyrosine phosphatase